MHQYHVQYQKVAGTAFVLGDATVKSDLPPSSFVFSLIQNGHWLEPDKTWIAPGCIQQVVVVT